MEQEQRRIVRRNRNSAKKEKIRERIAFYKGKILILLNTSPDILKFYDREDFRKKMWKHLAEKNLKKRLEKIKGLFEMMERFLGFKIKSKYKFDLKLRKNLKENNEKEKAEENSDDTE